MKRELEALLFATDAPLTVGRLRKIFPDVETKELRTVVTELQQEYDASDHAFTVVEFGGGWQIATRPAYAPVVEKLFRTRRFARLSKAGLEVLAIVGYRQPITRLEIDEIRGVNSSGAIGTLNERNLVTVVGRSQSMGNPLLYGTTREFLNHLGLKGINQLPNLPDLEDVVADKDRLKEFAEAVGRDVTSDEIDDFFEPEPEQEAAPESADAEPDESPEESPAGETEASEPADEAAAASGEGDEDPDDRP
ncbi:MAG: SMC-Scp complex subunit ScpB [bacterium]|nr:SMC-Scp complex subunit ScpB [bacterium]